MNRFLPLFASRIAVAVAAVMISTTASAAATADTQAQRAKAPAPAAEPQVPVMTVAQILERHAAARGGVPAWKAVQTLQMSGKMEVGKGDNDKRAAKMVALSRESHGKASSAELAAANADPDTDKQIQLPFTLDLGRPNRMRMEIEFNGKTAVQVFDGEHGWKYRPFLNRKDVEPFSKDEARAETGRWDLDGPLIDYAAKGTKVELEGSDTVDGQPAYRLKVTAKGAPAKHVWIDAKSFLDVKIEGIPKRMDGKMHPVYVYQRDFRTVQGVLIPFQLETQVEGYAETHKALLEKAAVNPALDPTVFAKPRA